MFEKTSWNKLRRVVLFKQGISNVRSDTTDTGGVHTMNTTDIKSQLFGLINQIEDEETLLFIIEVIKRLKD